MRTVQIPSMLRDLVSSAILSVDGITFTRLDVCPYCGGPVKGHDIRRKRFATVRNKKENRRFMCLLKGITAKNVKDSVMQNHHFIRIHDWGCPSLTSATP